MSRLPRKAFETNYYHVIVQGIGKEKIFEQGWMKAEYLNDLALYKDIHGIKVLTYVVMDNHCHMLLYAPDAPSLGAYMRRVNTRYAQFYNHMCERVGYVFRDRYKSQAIFDDDYLINCMVYIHNNPVKVGIVQNPADYAHSGMQCYYGRGGLVDRDAAAEFFDVDAANVEAVMQEKSAQADVWCPEWLDVPEESRSPYNSASMVSCSPGFRYMEEPSTPVHSCRTVTSADRSGHSSTATSAVISLVMLAMGRRSSALWA